MACCLTRWWWWWWRHPASSECRRRRHESTTPPTTSTTGPQCGPQLTCWSVAHRDSARARWREPCPRQHAVDRATRGRPRCSSTESPGPSLVKLDARKREPAAQRFGWRAHLQAYLAHPPAALIRATRSARQTGWHGAAQRRHQRTVVQEERFSRPRHLHVVLAWRGDAVGEVARAAEATVQIVDARGNLRWRMAQYSSINSRRAACRASLALSSVWPSGLDREQAVVHVREERQPGRVPTLREREATTAGDLADALKAEPGPGSRASVGRSARG